jgi:signal peptidase II
MHQLQEKINRRIIRQVAVVSLVSALIFFADRLVKYWFVAHPAVRRDVFVGWLGFGLTYNPGIAFGLPMPYGVLIGLVSFLLIGLMWGILRAYQQGRMSDLWGLALIAIGAISNGIDRLRFGAVVDYIDVPWFTVFNLADTAITIGVCVLLFTWRKQGTLDKRSDA